MPKRIAIANHLSTKELFVCYREAAEATERSHYQIIWLLATGKSVKEVSEVTGYTNIWIYQIIKRYNQDGVKGLANKRHLNQGIQPLLTDVQQAQLWQVLSEKAPDGGLWNGRKVADWLSELTGQKIDRRRGWEYLRQMTLRLGVTRKEHGETELVEQEDGKKTDR